MIVVHQHHHHLPFRCGLYSYYYPTDMGIVLGRIISSDHHRYRTNKHHHHHHHHHLYYLVIPPTTTTTTTTTCAHLQKKFHWPNDKYNDEDYHKLLLLRHGTIGKGFVMMSDDDSDDDTTNNENHDGRSCPTDRPTTTYMGST
jgi:hypothetical protein